MMIGDVREVPVLVGVFAVLVGACGAADDHAVAPPPVETTSTAKPVVTKPASSIVSLAVGHQRACAVRADGRVACWGTCHVCGGDVPPASPTLVEGIVDAVMVSGDDAGWCALERTGEVACFTGAKPPVRVPGLHDAVEVANACARRADGSVRCWEGEATPPSASPSPVVRLAQGYGSACAIRADGHLVCWQSVYPYPNGAMLFDTTPIEFGAPRDIEFAATSLMRGTCTKSRARNVECWGGEAAYANASTGIDGTNDAVALALAEYHGCVLKRDGRVACWGFNYAGQLGTPREEVEERWDARPIERLTGATFVATGSGEPASGTGSTCVVTREGEVRCWGAIAPIPGGVIDLTPR